MPKEKLNAYEVLTVRVKKWDAPRTPEDGEPDSIGEPVTTYYIGGKLVTDQKIIDQIKKSREAK